MGDGVGLGIAGAAGLKLWNVGGGGGGVLEGTTDRVAGWWLTS